MASSTTASSGTRNTLLHRFYEPLVLLYVLDPVQGDHVYPGTDRLPPRELGTKELRRRFLDSLSYVCDYEKGGDTVTAISVTNGPTYHVASNQQTTKEVKDFLSTLLSQLAHMPDLPPNEQDSLERSLIDKCAQFSHSRIETYWKLLKRALHTSLERCNAAGDDHPMVQKLRELCERLTRASEGVVELCRQCHSLMKKSSELDFMRDKAHACEAVGNKENPFADVTHFVGRLASHIREVKVLRAAAVRLPQLFSGFKIRFLHSPRSPALPPAVRSKLHLDGIMSRMVSNNIDLQSELKARLQVWDHLRGGGLEQDVRTVYGDKIKKPRVHAELILLEYFHRKELQYLDNDRFIGCSKPACYCCALYMQHHPARPEVPRTHQKIYLNWLPPTSMDATKVQDPNSRLALHERDMLNKIVCFIRDRTIGEIQDRLGRRAWHFDTVTGYVSAATLSVVATAPETATGRDVRSVLIVSDQDAKSITQVSVSEAVVDEYEVEPSDSHAGDSVPHEDLRDNPSVAAPSKPSKRSMKPKRSSATQQLKEPKSSKPPEQSRKSSATQSKKAKKPEQPKQSQESKMSPVTQSKQSQPSKKPPVPRSKQPEHSKKPPAPRSTSTPTRSVTSTPNHPGQTVDTNSGDDSDLDCEGGVHLGEP